MTKPSAILWFRQDLRLHDNPALNAALEQDYAIIPLFILDDENAGADKIGGASRWWLHQSLTALNKDLSGHMVFRKGNAQTILLDLIKETNATAIFWNRCYEPWRIQRDKDIKQALQSQDIHTDSFNASLLWEPWNVLKKDGTPYKVFTPYYRRGCLKTEPPQPEPKPKDIKYASNKANKGTPSDLGLMPNIKWYQHIQTLWNPGEKGAATTLEKFLESGLKGYKEGRDRPDLSNVSRLAPHLHWGEISVRSLWHTVQAKAHIDHLDTDADCFCSELGWREFSYSLLYHFPKITWDNLQTKFDKFPWTDEDTPHLTAWQQGKTGIPMVDAGMRQLWRDGWMHNRVRMITGSFLVKNLLIHWHQGEKWFWDTLLDADLASNSASWQWVAGSGADAAPYFRIFNPVTQGKKFDPKGEYVRKYIPELKNVPDKYIHTPWEASHLCPDYPAPIVDLKQSRTRALEAFKSISG